MKTLLLWAVSGKQVGAKFVVDHDHNTFVILVLSILSLELLVD
jgi:hypothetical protein